MSEIDRLPQPKKNTPANPLNKEVEKFNGTEAPGEYKEILKSMSQDDIDAIFGFLIHSGQNSTAINNAVQFYTGQNELEDYQRLLLAPANGIETFVRFVGSLATQAGREDLLGGIQNLPNLPEDMKKVFFVFYNKLNRTQKLAVGIEFSYNMIAAAKIVALLCNALKILNSLRYTGQATYLMNQAGKINWVALLAACPIDDVGAALLSQEKKMMGDKDKKKNPPNGEGEDDVHN